MLAVRPLTDNGDEIRHYTCPQAIIKSALYHELFVTMWKQDDQIIFHIGDMGSEYEGRAIEELYFRIIVKHMGTQRENNKSCTICRRYAGNR